MNVSVQDGERNVQKQTSQMEAFIIIAAVALYGVARSRTA